MRCNTGSWISSREDKKGSVGDEFAAPGYKNNGSPRMIL